MEGYRDGCSVWGLSVGRGRAELDDVVVGDARGGGGEPEEGVGRGVAWDRGPSGRRCLRFFSDLSFL